MNFVNVMTKRNLFDNLIEDARFLVKIIMSDKSGDVLNHVNACSAFRAYLAPDHWMFNKLIEPLELLPISHGAGKFYDLILRFSASALINHTEINLSSELPFLRNIIAEYDNTIVKRNTVNVDHLYDLWKNDKFTIHNSEPRAFFLFVQYVVRLNCDSKIEISNKEIERLLALSFKISTPINIKTLSIEQIANLISIYLLGASNSHRFKNTEVTKHFVNIVSELVSILDRCIGPPNDKTDEYNAIFTFDNVCFIGYNLYLLDEYPNLIPLKTIVENRILHSYGDEEQRYREPRHTSLRLLGMRFLLSEKNVAQITHELEVGDEFATVLDIRKILQSVKYKELENILSKRGFSLTNFNYSELHTLINSIENRQTRGRVQHPLDTLNTNSGDCKAVAALAALLLLINDMPAYLSLSLAKDFDPSKENHVFVEIINKKDIWGKKPDVLPVDRTLKLGEYHQSILKDKLIRYDIQELIKTKEIEILSDLSAKRTHILSEANTN